VRLALGDQIGDALLEVLAELVEDLALTGGVETRRGQAALHLASQVRHFRLR
jgi:hypothetical protein